MTQLYPPRRLTRALALVALAGLWLPLRGWATDVRLVVDVSAATSAHDTGNLRSEALGLLLRLLPEDGRAGVWVYADSADVLVKHGRSDALWRETAVIRTRTLPEGGRYANLLEALDRASWDRSAAAADPVHVVVLSGAGLEVAGDPAANAATERRLLWDLLPELRRAGYQVHTLALPDAADPPLLEQLAAGTGGYHGRIDAELPERFVGLLGRMTRVSGVETAEDGGFRVHAGITDFTVLRFGGTDHDVVLVDPAGNRYRRTTAQRRVRWHLDDGYELVSVARPAPGQWRFEGPVRDVRVLAYGDLAAEFLDLPGMVFPGDLRSFELQVTSAGEPVTDRDFLRLLDLAARLHGPEGEVPLVVEPADQPGRFRVHLVGLWASGDYRLETRLRGPTFAHRQTVPFVLKNPLRMEVRPAADGFVAWVEVAAPDLDYRSLRLAALVKRPPGAARPFVLERLPSGLWKLPVKGGRGLVEITLDIRGKYLSGKEFVMHGSPFKVTLPVTDVLQQHLDLQGRPVLRLEAATVAGPGVVPAAPPQPRAQPRSAAVAKPVPATEAGDELRFPVWLAVMVALVNLAIGLSAWLLVGARRPGTDRLRALDRLRGLLGLEPHGDEDAETPPAVA